MTLLVTLSMILMGVTATPGQESELDLLPVLGEIALRVEPSLLALPSLDHHTRAWGWDAGVRPVTLDPAWQLDRQLLIDGGYYLIQFSDLPDAGRRLALTDLGIDFIEYQNDRVWLTYLPSGALSVVEDEPEVTFVSVYEPIFKVPTELREMTGILPIAISFFPTGNLLHDLDQTSAAGLRITNTEFDAGLVAHGEIAAGNIAELAGGEGVAWIDLEAPPQDHMDIIRSTQMIGSVLPTAGGYNGATILGQVQDGGIDLTHPGLTNVIYTDGVIEPKAHGTSTAGIVMGTGVIDAQATGMLPGLVGAFANYSTGIITVGTNLWNGNFNEGPAGMNGLFQSNSWAYMTPMDGNYSVESWWIDTVGNNFRNQLTFWSAGNAGDGTGIGVISRTGMAKNIVTVGGFDHYNTGDLTDDAYNDAGPGSTPSRGPAADGRQKPDLSAPFDRIYTTDMVGAAGYCPAQIFWCLFTSSDDYIDSFGGTSGSAPIVAGAGGILYSMYIDDWFGNNPTNAYPLSSTIKALLIADAYQYPLTQNGLTRNVQGWGTPDLENTWTLGAAYHVIDEPAAIGSGGSWTRSVFSDGVNPLKITLAWTEPPSPAGTGDARASFNNLDLHVTDPGGTEYWGNNGLLSALFSSPGTGANDWQFGAPAYADGLNTVENVFIQTPAVGMWTIEVLGRTGDIAIGPQAFSVVTAGAIIPPGFAPNMTVMSPDGAEAWPVGSIQQISWFTEDTEDATSVLSVDLYYSNDSGGSWIAIPGGAGLAGDSSPFAWTIPNDPTFTALVRAIVTDGDGLIAVDVSNATFTIVDPIPPAPPTGLTVEHWGNVGPTNVANADIVVDNGGLVGTYLDTQVADDTRQVITEMQSGGNPSNRYSFMEHKWTLSLPVASGHILYFEGYHTPDADGDQFEVAYSTDDISYTPLFWVTGIAGDSVYAAPLPAAVSGTVYVRVTDTDRSPGADAEYATVYVDRLWVDSATVPVTDHNTLNWTLSLDDGAGADDVVEYRIFRSAVSTGPWDGTTLIATVGPGNDTYLDIGRGQADAVLWWYVVRALDSQNEETNVMAVQEPSGPVDDPPGPPAGLTVDHWGAVGSEVVADGEVAVDNGGLVGTYLDSQVSDDVYEDITESESGGNPANRYSFLEHKWTFTLTGAANQILSVEAFHSADADGDSYQFAYSTDDISYAPMFSVTKLTDDDSAQTYSLSGVSGTLWVRVQDTDRTTGANADFSTLSVDYIGVMETAGNPLDHNMLNWTLSADDGGGEDDVTVYAIYRSALVTGPWDGTTLVTTVPAGTLSYTDLTRGQADATLWWYVVRAQDAIQDDGNSAPVQEPGMIDVTPPVADPSAGGFNLSIITGTDIGLDGSASTDDVGVVAWWWNFSDGGPQSLTGVSSAYSWDNPGNFTVTLEVADPAGNTGSTTFWVNVSIPDLSPIADPTFGGSNITILTGSDAGLDGSASTDDVGIVAYWWNFTDGVPQSLSGITPAYLWNNPGNFTINLTVMDTSGQTDSYQFWIEVVGPDMPPIADPTAGGNNITIPTGTDAGLDGSASTDDLGITTYWWNFTDSLPQSLTGITPAYTWNNLGNFTINLSVMDTGGQTDSYLFWIQVNPTIPPLADAGPDQVVPEDSPVVFDASASTDDTGIANYTWTFSDGGPQALWGVAPAYSFAQPGVYNVTLNVTDLDGNWDIDWVMITVLDVTAPIAKAGIDQSVLAGTLVTFNGSASIDNVAVVNWTWTVRETVETTLWGVSPTHVFALGGNYSVKLEVRDAAGNWGIDTLTTMGGTLTSGPFSSSAIWDGQYVFTFGGNTPFNDVIERYEPATDTVTVMGATLPAPLVRATAVWDGQYAFIFGGNNGVETDEILRYDPATDTVITLPGKLPLTLTGASAVWTGQYAYIFGGSSGGSGQQSIIRYDPGTDTSVYMTATFPTDSGESAAVWDGQVAYIIGGMFRDTIFVYSPANDTLQLMGPTLPAMRALLPGVWTGWEATVFGGWNLDTDEIVYYDPFLDVARLSTVTLPTMRYGMTAVWTGDCALVLGGYDGAPVYAIQRFCPAYDVVNIEVIAPDLPPVADPTAGGYNLTILQGSDADLNGSASTDDNGIVSYWWNFTDGGAQSLSGITPAYIWNNLGNFTINLTVMDTAGQTDTISIWIQVIISDQPPIADPRAGNFNQSIPSGFPALLLGSDSSDDIGIVTYWWNFTDGGPQSLVGILPAYVWNNVGNFTINLTVMDTGGQTDSYLFWLEVFDATPPIANATAGGYNVSVPQGSDIDLNGSASSDNVGIVEFRWQFFDGALQTLFGITPAYTWNNLGNVTVTLRVTDGMGMIDEVTFWVQVTDGIPPIADPRAGGTNISLPQGTDASLDGSASTDAVGITGFWWNFTDTSPQTLVGIAPAYTWATIGNHTVTLEVTDAVGLSDTYVFWIFVTDGIAPIADARNGTFNQTITRGSDAGLDASASFDNLGITQYIWSFTDSTPQNLFGLTPAYVWNNPGNFTITLLVADAAGNFATYVFWIQVVAHTIPVTWTGLQLVSFPTDASGPVIGILDDSLGDGLTTWDRAWAYSPMSGWDLYNINRPAYMNGLGAVDRSMGLWVNITAVGDGELSVAGTYPGSGVIALSSGWNLVGYPTLAIGQTVSSALIGVSYSRIETDDQFLDYRLHVLAGGDIMEPYAGYWIMATGMGLWVLPGP